MKSTDQISMAEASSFCDDIKSEVERRVKVEQMTWRRGYYDFCLIHCEDDIEEAASFRAEFCSKYDLTGVMESDAIMSSISSEFDRIEEMVNRSTKIFLFITERFNKDKLCRLQKNELLSRHIRSRQHILPIYIKQSYFTDVPWGLTGMIGFKMYQEEKERRRIEGTFNKNVREQRIAREADEKRRLEQKTSKLHSKILNEVEVEYRLHRCESNKPSRAECANSEGKNEVCCCVEPNMMQSTHFTKIEEAGSVISGPVFNISVEKGAVVNINNN